MMKRNFLFIFTYILSYYAWIFYTSQNEALLLYGGNAFQVLAAFLAVGIGLIGYRSANQEDKVFKRLILSGLFSFLIGMLLWAFHDIIFGIEYTFVGVYDYIWMLQYLFYFIAVFYYIHVKKIYPSTHFILDTLIFGAVSYTLCWYYFIDPYLTAGDYPFLTLFIYVSYPLMDLALIFAILSLFLYKTPSKLLLTLILGFAVKYTANAYYLSFISQEVYQTGHLLDPLWTLGVLLIAQSINYREKESKQSEFPGSKIRKYFKLVLPYLSVIVLLILIIKNTSDLSGLFIGGILAFSMVMIRQFYTILINERLTDEIREKNDQLSEALEKVQFFAYHDPLTNLPNRLYFNKRFEEELEEAKKKKTRLSIMFIDLDKFKEVNDTFGHNKGDWLLQQSAHRLNQQIEQRDFLSRISGDEFIILLPNSSATRDRFIAQKIMKALEEPFRIEGCEVCISASIGISIYEEGKTASELLKQADMAMYHTKQKSRKDFCFYEENMREKTRKRFGLDV